MGYKELIESLLDETEKKISSLWEEAETVSVGVAAEQRKKIASIREAVRKKQTLIISKESDRILAGARSSARKTILLALKDLSGHLYRNALSMLHTLRDDNYRKVFDLLVKELPTFRWHTIRVNPEDVTIAEGYFPDSSVVADGKITGGLDVMTEDGRVRVINTFEKRLERIWDDLLSLLIRDIHE
jgi:vacuolar-type H+-ATPase subunit E/Vma4